MSGADTIIGIIDNVRRRLSRVNRLRVAAYVAIVGAAAVVAGTLLFGLWPMSAPPAWMAASVKILALLALAATLFLFIMTLKTPGRRDTALAIERSVEDINNDLIVSLELVENERLAHNVYSDELARMHVALAADRLGAVDFSPAIPFDKLEKALLAALAAALIAIVAGLLLPEGFRAATAFLMAPRLTPDRNGEAAVRELPLTLGDIEIRYDYPSYSGKSSETHEAVDGNIEALKGTVASYSARSTDPIQSAGVKFEKSSMPAKVLDGGVIEVSIPVTEKGSYKIEAVGTDGTRYAETRAHSIEVVPDTYPVIDLVEPRTDIEVEEAEVLELTFRSEDDYGVKKVDLVYSINGAQDRVTAVEPDDPERVVSGRYDWDMKALNLQPGDKVSYYIEVWDNDEVSGPKKTASKTLAVDIYDPRREHQEIVDRQYALLRQMVLLLGDALVHEPQAGGNIGDEQFGVEKKFSQTIGSIRDEISKLLDAMENDRFSEMGVYMALENINVDFKTMSENRGRQINGEVKRASVYVSLNEAEKPVLERDVYSLDKVLERQRLLDMQSAMEDLMDAQRELSDLIAKAKAGDEDAKRQLPAAIAKMQEAMRRLRNLLAKGSKGLPDEFLNSDAMKNFSLSEAMDSFSALQNALADNDLDAALEMAQMLQNSMAQMMAQMQGGMGQYGDSAYGEEMAELVEVMHEIDEAAEAQRKIYQETQRIGVESQKDLIEAQQKKIDQYSDRIEELFRELLEVLDKTYGYARNVNAKPDMDRARFLRAKNNITNNLYTMKNNADYAGKIYREGDLYRFRQEMVFWKSRIQTVRMSAQMLDNLGEFDEDAAKVILDDAARMAEIVDEILRMLDDILVPPERRLSEEDKKRMDELAEEQAALEKKASELQGRMEALREKLPMIPDMVPQNLGNASKAMNKAGGELEGKNPDGAMPGEAESLKNLEAAGNGLREMGGKCPNGKCSGMGMPIPMPIGAGGVSSGGRDKGYQRPGRFTPGQVEVPGRAGYKVPKKYRDEILKAMKNKSPDQYRDLNRDYYRKLVE